MISDWIKPHELLFNNLKPKIVLEFGLGEGSEFFLKNCQKLISVEPYTTNQELIDTLHLPDLRWANLFKQVFSHYNNWIVVPYECKEAILKADKEAQRGDKMQDPISQEYKKEIQDLVDKICEEYHPDYAFVDHGLHLRGDFVNALFGRVKAIGAHDTNTKGSYGYHRVVSPADYIKEEYPNGEGTTFWIRNDISKS